MIFLDTSWLVKLYVDEPGAAAVRAAVPRHGRAVVSEVARVEFHSAVRRRRDDATLRPGEATALIARFRAEWNDRMVLSVSAEVLDRAVALASSHPLRALDAVQLASALVVADGVLESFVFGTSDARLGAAARVEGLVVRAR